MFNNWRAQWHRSSLLKKLKSIKIDRTPQSFADAKSIGILFDATNVDARSVVDDYMEDLKKQGKKVELLGYLDDKIRHNDLAFKHYNKRDLNLFFQPNSPIVQKFYNTPFDILICLCTGKVLPLEYVAAMSKANLRVGRYYDDRTYCYDLMIDSENGNDLGKFLKQIDRLLKIVNRPNVQYA